MPATPVTIAPQYAKYVQTRPSSVNPGVLEYFNPTNQQGFSTPEEVYRHLQSTTGQSVNDLGQLTDHGGDTAKYAGQSGLNLDDYLKLAGGSASVSGDERNKVNADLGIPDIYKQLFTPAPATQDIYNNAYKSAGLGDLKKSIEAKLAEVNRIQSAYTGKGGKINENPWLSDASRTGRLRQLDDQRLQEIGNLANELKSIQDLYGNGINEVNSVVGRTTQDFSNNQQLNQMKLQYLQQQAEQQLQDLLGSKKSAAYQYLPDYLQAKAASQKPDTIGSPEMGYFAWNPNTSTFDQVVAPKAKASGGGGGSGGSTKITSEETASKATQYLDMNKGGDLKVSPEVWQTALNAWLDDNHPVSEFVARFGNYINKNDPGWEVNYAGL